eukprot:3017486-Prymnesium_polylepis.1
MPTSRGGGRPPSPNPPSTRTTPSPRTPIGRRHLKALTAANLQRRRRLGRRQLCRSELRRRGRLSRRR